MRKATTIRKDLDKASLAADKAQRAVYALVAETNVRLCDIIAANHGHSAVAALDAAFARVASLRDELRWA
jgi:hypothetical protein